MNSGVDEVTAKQVRVRVFEAITSVGGLTRRRQLERAVVLLHLAHFVHPPSVPLHP